MIAGNDIVRKDKKPIISFAQASFSVTSVYVCAIMWFISLYKYLKQMKYREKRFLSDKYGFKICKIRFTTQLNLANDDYSF